MQLQMSQQTVVLSSHMYDYIGGSDPCHMRYWPKVYLGGYAAGLGFFEQGYVAGNGYTSLFSSMHVDGEMVTS